MDNVAVLHLVHLPFLPPLARRLDGCTGGRRGDAGWGLKGRWGGREVERCPVQGPLKKLAAASEGHTTAACLSSRRSSSAGALPWRSRQEDARGQAGMERTASAPRHSAFIRPAGRRCSGRRSVRSVACQLTRLAPVLLHVLKRHHLGADEAALKVRVDGARRLRRLRVLTDLPAAHLRAGQGGREGSREGRRREPVYHALGFTGKGTSESLLVCCNRQGWASCALASAAAAAVANNYAASRGAGSPARQHLKIIKRSAPNLRSAEGM